MRKAKAEIKENGSLVKPFSFIFGFILRSKMHEQALPANALFSFIFDFIFRRKMHEAGSDCGVQAFFYHFSSFPNPNATVKTPSITAIPAIVKKRYIVLSLPLIRAPMFVIKGARKTPTKELLRINALFKVS